MVQINDPITAFPEVLAKPDERHLKNEKQDHHNYNYEDYFFPFQAPPIEKKWDKKVKLHSVSYQNYLRNIRNKYVLWYAKVYRDAYEIMNGIPLIKEPVEFKERTFTKKSENES